MIVEFSTKIMMSGHIIPLYATYMPEVNWKKWHILDDDFLHTFNVLFCFASLLS